MSVIVRSFFTAAVLVFCTPADGAFSNYNSILFGEQAAGMGGAYTALSGDAAAVAFYNPAALGDIEQSSISASVTVFKKFDTVYGRADDILTAGLRSNQGFFQSIPSSSGSILKRRKFNLALTILSPDNYSFSGEVHSDDRNTSLLSKVDESLWIGLSGGAAISTTEFLGLSLFYTARNYRRTVSDRSLLDGNEVQTFSEDKELTANSLVGIIGYQKVLSEEWRTGISIRLPSLRVSGSGSYHSSSIDTSTGDESSESLVDLPAQSPIPGSVRLGVAYKYRPHMLFSLDLVNHFGITYQDLNEREAADLVVHRPTLDMAFGVDYGFRDWLRVRGGVYTNRTSHPRPRAERKMRQPAAIDQYGFSLNLSLIENDNIHYTFGGYYTGGVGTSLQHVDQNLIEIKTTEQIFTMLVGTSYYF